MGFTFLPSYPFTFSSIPTSPMPAHRAPARLEASPSRASRATRTMCSQDSPDSPSDRRSRYQAHRSPRR